MSGKTNANGLRIGINKNWTSRWLNNNGKEFGKQLVLDEKIRTYLLKEFNDSQIDRIEIEKKTKLNSFDKEKNDTLNIVIYCCQIGLINDEKNQLATMYIQKLVGRKIKVNLAVVDFGNPNWSARIIARKIADDIVNRVPFRVAQKNAIKNVMGAKALGVRTQVSGRLNGVDMARTEGYTEGHVPLSTLRADIDYAMERSETLQGTIGVKVWINHGEIFAKGLNNQIKAPKQEFKKEFRKERGRS